MWVSSCFSSTKLGIYLTWGSSNNGTMSSTIVFGVSPSAVSPVTIFCSRLPTEFSLCLSKNDMHSCAMLKWAEYLAFKSWYWGKLVNISFISFKLFAESLGPELLSLWPNQSDPLYSTSTLNNLPRVGSCLVLCQKFIEFFNQAIRAFSNMHMTNWFVHVILFIQYHFFCVQGSICLMIFVRVFDALVIFCFLDWQ